MYLDGEDGDDEEALTTAMQKRTRAIHDISDKLVNAKLLMAFSDRKVSHTISEDRYGFNQSV